MVVAIWEAFMPLNKYSAKQNHLHKTNESVGTRQCKWFKNIPERRITSLFNAVLLSQGGIL